MATIVRKCLLEDIKFYLPEYQMLTDAMLNRIGEDVIAVVGDDDTKLAEVLCKSLQKAAYVNRAKVTASPALKKEVRGGVEVELFHSNSGESWDNYINYLSTLCPMLPYGGYNLATAIGVFISPGRDINILECCDTPDSLL